MSRIEQINLWVNGLKWLVNTIRWTSQNLVDNFIMVWEVTQVETLESFVSSKFDLSKIRWFALNYLEWNKKPPVLEEVLIGRYVAHVKTKSGRRFKIQRLWFIPDIGGRVYFNKSLVQHQYDN